MLLAELRYSSVMILSTHARLRERYMRRGGKDAIFNGGFVSSQNSSATVHLGKEGAEQTLVEFVLGGNITVKKIDATNHQLSNTVYSMTNLFSNPDIARAYNLMVDASLRPFQRPFARRIPVPLSNPS